MRTAHALLLAAEVALAAVLASTENFDPKEWIMVPYPNYTMYPVRISEVKSIKRATKGANFTVDFYLFTKKNANNPQKIATGDEIALKESHFNPENPTRFLIHGWLEKNTQQESLCTMIRDRYLSVGPFNIFIVNWSAGTSLNYVPSAFNTLSAGRKIGAFIEFLITKGKLKAIDTYIAGISLGAHVAGIAGKSVTSQKINTIFGLDPARSLFTDAKPEKCLTKDDALYVETIHTSAGHLGLEGPIGHASFYPNYGSLQPECSPADELTGCSHYIAYEYFAKSITTPDDFWAVQCSSYSDIAKKNCHPTKITLRMGGDPSNYGHSYPGVYYLSTNANEKLPTRPTLSVFEMKPGLGYVVVVE